MSGSVSLECVSRRRRATRDGPCNRERSGAPPAAEAALTTSPEPGQVRPAQSSGQPSGLVEAAGDQGRERIESAASASRPRARISSVEPAAAASIISPMIEVPQTTMLSLRDLDLGHELLGHVDEPGRGARVQAAAVDDRHAAPQQPRPARAGPAPASAAPLICGPSPLLDLEQGAGDVDVLAPGLLGADHRLAPGSRCRARWRA